MTTLFDIKAHKGDIGGSICTPYKFNGKELDQETGYYYYGARYYDPGTALWFGTDPLAHKYPMYSPYVYCCANPVIAIDENGEWVNYVVGAVLGATVEYGTQVSQNLIENPNNIMRSLIENIDVFDIAVAAVVGAITSGSSVIENKSNNKTTKEILNSKNTTTKEARKEALDKLNKQKIINKTLKNASNNTATQIGKKSINGALMECD